MTEQNINDKVNEAIRNIPAIEIQEAAYKKTGLKPTIKQIEYSKEDMLLGNHTKAYEQVYKPIRQAKNTKEVNACNLSKNTKVIISKQEILDRIQAIVPKAVSRLSQLIDQSKNLLVARQASDSILDRAGYTPVQKTENLTISVSKEQFDRLLRHMED